MTAETMFEKIWNRHRVLEREDKVLERNDGKIEFDFGKNRPEWAGEGTSRGRAFH